jgi:hypothetical protein
MADRLAAVRRVICTVLLLSAVAASPGIRSSAPVTNLWVNRMIGDRQPDAPRQYTFTRPVFYKANSPLLPSGLLGPVRVLQVRAGAPQPSSSRLP